MPLLRPRMQLSRADFRGGRSAVWSDGAGNVPDAGGAAAVKCAAACTFGAQCGFGVASTKCSSNFMCVSAWALGASSANCSSSFAYVRALPPLRSMQQHAAMAMASAPRMTANATAMPSDNESKDMAWGRQPARTNTVLLCLELLCVLVCSDVDESAAVDGDGLREVPRSRSGTSSHRAKPRSNSDRLMPMSPSVSRKPKPICQSSASCGTPELLQALDHRNQGTTSSGSAAAAPTLCHASSPDSCLPRMVQLQP
mmetsp:Transcript_49793/g.144787  ORF Transcript_49793/g.144787 Transcript_49793/m.144787 type:complete len:255 (+) Transcript_49793:422-1186(+)